VEKKRRMALRIRKVLDNQLDKIGKYITIIIEKVRS